MKLPFSDKAQVSEQKLADYILSETHIVGKLKAKFFRSKGFNETNIVLLKRALLKIVVEQDIKIEAASDYGKKYIIDGEIEAPNREVISIRTVWIIETGQKVPRFVTAYPV